MLSHSLLRLYALTFSFCLADDPDTSDPARDPNRAPGFSGTYSLPQSPKYAYQEALHKSFLFYAAQRSGKISEHRLAWRTDSCLKCQGKFGEDLSGGWYEAANTMKWWVYLRIQNYSICDSSSITAEVATYPCTSACLFVLFLPTVTKRTQPLAWTVTQLAYSIYQFGDAMDQVNEKAEALKVVKWGSDYCKPIYIPAS